MAPFILILFIAVPVIEIGLFVQVGGVIGLWPTLAVVILTAVLGTALLRHQGLDTLRRVQDSLAQDRLPVAEMFDGLCLLMAGALLLTPGFMTDAFGFLLFVPPFRAAAAQAIGRYVLSHGRVHVQTSGLGSGPGPDPRRGPGGGPVIDGDFEEVAPETAALDGRDPTKRPDGPPDSR
ncbi:MAG: FxsA family protein [Rhodospirillales bacterium]